MVMEPCPHPWPSAKPAVAIPEVHPVEWASPTRRTRLSFTLVESFTETDAEDWDDTMSLPCAPQPWILPVGCNAYFKDTQWIWLRIDAIGDGPERDDVDHVGRRRDWYDRVLDDTGWDGLFETSDWLDFLAREGIAPGQSFLAQVTYSCSRDYWGEWDSDFNVAVVRRAPITQVELLAAWSVMSWCS